MRAEAEKTKATASLNLQAFVRRAMTGEWSVIAMGIFVAAALIALLGLELWRDRVEIESQAFRETSNLAAVLDSHVARTMTSADEMLVAFVTRSQLAWRSGTLDVQTLSDEALLLLPGLQQVNSLVLLDASGQVLISTSPFVKPGADYSNAEYFHRVVADGQPQAKPYIGSLFRGRSSGNWLIPMTRGVYDGGGKFLGVAILTIDPSAFVDLFSVLDIDRFSAVTLMQSDGVIVARSPDQDMFVGKTVAGGELDRRVAAQSPAGSVRIKGVLYGRDLFMSYRSVAGAPFVINVAFDANRVLVPWGGLAQIYAVLGLALLAAIAACVGLVRRDQFRRLKAEATQQVHDIIEGMSAQVALLTIDGTVVAANRAALAAASLTQDDVIGRLLWNTFWYAHSAESQKRIRAAVERAGSGEIVRGDFTVRTGLAAFMTVDTSFQPVHESAGGTKCIIASGVDVTEQRSLEQQLRQSQKMEAIGLLAGGIAHDFNNLLGIIANFAQFLVDDLKSQAVEQSYALRIAKACERGKQVVAQLLAYARPAAVARTSTNLNSVLAEVETMVRPSLQSPTALLVELGSAPVNVTANEAQLTQIFVNLCLNAHDALEGKQGAVHVRLSSVSPSDPGHPAQTASRSGDPSAATHRGGVADAIRTYALVTVADTGSGMDAETLRHVFEPFYTTKPHGQGTGLGLAVVDGIVLSLGGVYYVESGVGHGTRFSIYLPLEFASTTTNVPVAPAGPVRERLRVLVIDDDLSVGDAMALTIDRLGHDVLAVADPLEGLAVFREDPFAWDIVITDEHMPKLRGSALIAKLKAVRPDIPIILCTASDSISEAVARLRGADVYLAKPADPARLAEAISAAARPALSEVG